MNLNKFLIEDLCEKVISGGTPLRSRTEYYEGGEIPWIKTKEVNFNRIYDSTEKITQIGLINSSAKLIPSNSILIAMYGDGNTAGRCAINKIPVSTNQACCNLIINKEKADPDFMFYKISTLYKTFVGLKVGGSQQNLNSKTIKEFKIDIPSLSTQQKIASILSAYDDLIENNLRRIKLLEAKAEQRYKILEPKLKISLIKIADYLGRGITPKYENGSNIFIINQKSNKGSTLDFKQFKELDPQLEVPEEKWAKFGDLLINSLGEGTLGRVHFYTGDSGKYAVDQHMSIFRTERLYYTFYLYQFFNSDHGRGLIESLKKGGTNMTMLNISDLRKLEIKFPLEKELKETWEIVKPIYNLKQTLLKQNILLCEARDILLPRLMREEIEV